MKPDCYQHILCKTRHGEVWTSDCCGRYKVVYNNIVMIHGYESYLSFFMTVEQCHYQCKDMLSNVERSIEFGSHECKMMLYFSPQEIAELYYLLQSALIENNIHV